MASELRELARLHGIQQSYVDLRGRRRSVDRDTLIAVLRALGAPVETSRDVPDAVRERRDELARRLVEPVAVAWGGHGSAVLSLPARRVPEVVRCRLVLEDGTARSWEADASSLRPISGSPLPGLESHDAAELPIPGPLPLGYHRLEVEFGGGSGTTLIVSAPVRATDTIPPGSWGVFGPLHGLHRERSWGVGDLSDLAALMGSVREAGGTLVGTLPLYAAFLRDPVEPSPYSPVSRLFWNELFLDVEALPEMERAPEARRLAGSAGYRREIEQLMAGELVDHAGAMAVKRRVLEELARALMAEPSLRRSALETFSRERPRLDDYARFRTAGERWGVDWRRWPGPPRDGRLEGAELDRPVVDYHRYVQWTMEEQLRSLTGSEGGALYLDLPLGVHPDGYDVWRERDAFAHEVSTGAPPDDFFPGGQDWGFPPPHPEQIRAEGYAYQIESLRHAMRHARALRVDHVMGLHRLYWIPHGRPADRGVYVRYRADEWYAILALESYRAGTTVVGEDLGTVPREVRASMRRHGLLRSYVAQMEVDPDRTPTVPDPHRRSLASLNTHDMPPFAAFWRGLDIRDRLARGLLTESQAELERERRARLRTVLLEHLRSEGLLHTARPDEQQVLTAWLAALGGSPAEVVIVALDDLVGETRSQNLPGVGDHPNWRLRSAHPLERAAGLPQVADRLRLVGSLRRDASERRTERPARRP